MASKALSVVGRLNITYEAWRKPWDRETGDGSGSGKAADEDGWEEKGNQMSKDEGGRNSSFSEKPVRSRARRLVDWINPTGAKKVHSLIDKVYKRKNLEMARACLPSLVNSFSSISEAGVFVKAACGKSARAVWAADGG
jgi:hypothetical protein